MCSTGAVAGSVDYHLSDRIESFPQLGQVVPSTELLHKKSRIGPRIMMEDCFYGVAYMQIL